MRQFWKINEYIFYSFCFCRYEEFEHPVTKEMYRSAVGYCSVYKFYAYPDNIRARISQFFILPPHQRRGIGSQLYRTIIEDIKKIPKVIDVTGTIHMVILYIYINKILRLRVERSKFVCTFIRFLKKKYTYDISCLLIFLVDEKTIFFQSKNLHPSSKESATLTIVWRFIGNWWMPESTYVAPARRNFSSTWKGRRSVRGSARGYSIFWVVTRPGSPVCHNTRSILLILRTELPQTSR